MENYYNKNFGDITYKSELIPPFWGEDKLDCQKGGINSLSKFMFIPFHKFGAH